MVVGFSGGNKYFFPGIAGSEIINITHWIGALHTSYKIIGTKDTPVRRVIDRAAFLLPKPRQAICTVVCHEGVNGVYVGTPEEAYSAAADLSAQTHIVWVDKPFRQALAVMPTLYDDLWTGAKGMYKLEAAMADGGEVIIYAPHITEISYTHGSHIRRVGYHVRDYFVKQMERFKDVPLSILAQSTHVRGIGTFENGIERPRVRVTLATKIPEAVCKEINLEYRDWKTIHDGEHYRAHTSTGFRPTPLQQPRIPVWVAGTWPARPAFPRAARFDGVFPTLRGASVPQTVAPEVLAEAVDYALNAGVIIVAAAGNAGSPGVHYPAADQRVVAVGSSAPDDSVSTFSSYADAREIPDNGLDDDRNGWVDDVVDVVAPGEGIWSSWVLSAYDSLIYEALLGLEGWPPGADTYRQNNGNISRPF